ncbi:MAG: hypothetical protein BMS9Abin08_1126 [Gammaproteobacteria bacterium]|nr:MAG: hypothetical protein BMS9Abin08_1126 [Gammaproteobacteria bacterium]
MKIMILGLGKSGTTALLYKIAAGLPGCHAVSGGKPGKRAGNYENAVYKHTYEARKGKDFELYQAHLKTNGYDRKIWIARDPRDVAVSRMLYRWHRGRLGHKQQYQAHLDLVLKKEQDPASIPFCEICRYTGYDNWPRSLQSVLEEERLRYEEMVNFVSGLGDDWLLFSFEDMIRQNYAALNNYLGFGVKEDAEVPESTGKAKVIRKKSSGDWRHWFTEQDVELFKPVYLPYMQLMGYDCDDWLPSASPCIEPAYSSEYMQRLPERITQDAVRKLKKHTLQLFGRKAG